MTDIAVTSPVERIARVIAAEILSPNGEGAAPGGTSVSNEVNANWPVEISRALAVLRTLREPTPEMVEAGNAAGGGAAEIWSAMVRAAIEQHVDQPW